MQVRFASSQGYESWRYLGKKGKKINKINLGPTAATNSRCDITKQAASTRDISICSNWMFCPYALCWLPRKQTKIKSSINRLRAINLSDRDAQSADLRALSFSYNVLSVTLVTVVFNHDAVLPSVRLTANLLSALASLITPVSICQLVSNLCPES